MQLEIQQLKKPPQLSVNARELLAEAKLAGFRRLGWLSMSMRLPLHLAAFANDDGDIALIVVGRADQSPFEPMYFDLFSDLVGPKKLTTSTSALNTSFVDWGIFKYSYDNASVDDVLSKHRWHLRRLKSTPASFFRTLSDVEKSIQECIDYENKAFADTVTSKATKATQVKAALRPDRRTTSPDDPFSAIRAAATDGVNYELLTQDIIARLKQWQSYCKFRVVAAERDAVDIKFITLPKDMDAFARELYDFCPDLVEQGTEAIPETLEIFKLAGKKPPKAMQKLVNGIDFEDENYGLEILKRQIQQRKKVKLWWD